LSDIDDNMSGPRNEENIKKYVTEEYDWDDVYDIVTSDPRWHDEIPWYESNDIIGFLEYYLN